jgi:hypothetical protein
MNNNIPYYSAISREAIVKRIMKYAGEEYTFDAFKAKDVMSAATTATKSMTIEKSHSSRQQYGPIYMGDKPIF